VLAALGPKMLELAAKRSDGAHSYNVPPEHTAKARELMGAGKLLCVEQAAVLETDASKARQIARKFLDVYLGLPNYTNNFLRLGFTEEDIKGGGSDRLIDAIVAWGDLKSVQSRVQAHLDAGADHVCIQALSGEANALPLREWREFAALIR